MSRLESGVCNLLAAGEAAERGTVPCLLEYTSGSERRCYTFGLVGAAGMSAVAWASGDPVPPRGDGSDSPGLPELLVRHFGPDGATAQQLIGQVGAWDAAGRPGLEGLHIAAYASDRGTHTVDERALPGHWYRLVLGWR